MKITRRQLRDIIMREADEKHGPPFTDEHGNEWTLNFKQGIAIRCPSSTACTDKRFDDFTDEDQKRIEAERPRLFKGKRKNESVMTRRQLMRIIKESFSGYADERPRNPMERHYAGVIKDYEVWVQAQGHITPAASSVLATYIIGLGLDERRAAERTSILASEYKIDKLDVGREIKIQTQTQKKHPLDVDGDGKLTIYEMKITRRQIRRLIKEELGRL